MPLLTPSTATLAPDGVEFAWIAPRSARTVGVAVTLGLPAAVSRGRTLTVASGVTWTVRRYSS